MTFTAAQIAQFLNGIVEGNQEITVNNISKIDDSQPNTITFLANPIYTKFIYETKASIVIVSKDFVAEKEIYATLIRVENPYLSFTNLLNIVEQSLNFKKTGISTTAMIPTSTIFENKDTVWIADYVVLGENVKIGDNVKIYPHVFIDDNSIIESNTILYSSVKIYKNSIIGSNCILHSGVVVGSDGFGFAIDNNLEFKKIPQLGNVIIENNVEIGSNTCIDRATIGSTIIKTGTKLDNLIQVAHNVEIGRNTVVASQTGFSGSSKIGNYCQIGGQVGVAGHIKVGNNVLIAAQSGLANDIPNDSKLMGSPAIEASKYKRIFVIFKKLTEIYSRLNSLEKKINEK